MTQNGEAAGGYFRHVCADIARNPPCRGIVDEEATLPAQSDGLKGAGEGASQRGAASSSSHTTMRSEGRRGDAIADVAARFKGL